MKKIIGALFDWDGVVADSGAAHEASWKELAKLNGLPLPEGFFKSTFGKRNLEIIMDILRWTPDPAEAQRLSDQKEGIYRAGIAKNGLPTIRGAVAFVRALKSAGIPRASGFVHPARKSRTGAQSPRNGGRLRRARHLRGRGARASPSRTCT